ncbi:MAG TPA: hypothetical protein VG759_27145 [Candidatus Angelobacter sp.]|nr:hypothetical protein [Candidatus Angelobacter sp.]
MAEKTSPPATHQANGNAGQGTCIGPVLVANTLWRFAYDSEQIIGTAGVAERAQLFNHTTRGHLWAREAANSCAQAPVPG